MAMSKNTAMAAAAAKEHFGNRWFSEHMFDHYMKHYSPYYATLKTFLKYNFVERRYEEVYDLDAQEEFGEYGYRFI